MPERYKPKIDLPAIRPSSAEQWVNCPGSARVNYVASLDPEPSKPYAAEGTAAHAYLECLLTAHTVDEQASMLRECIEGGLNPDEAHLVDAVAADILYTRDVTGSEMFVEHRVAINLGDVKTEGTIDCLLVNDTTVRIIDLKWGQGIPVSPEYNLQLLLYAHGVMQWLNKCSDGGHDVILEIVQPRRDTPGRSTWFVPDGVMLDSIMLFVETARLCYEPETTYNPGDHCRWCAGTRGYCPRMLSDMIDITAQAMAGDPKQPDAPWWILDREKEIKKMLTAVNKRADDDLAEGRPVPGWALGTKVGNSRWRCSDDVAWGLHLRLGSPAKDYLRPSKPISVTDARKQAKAKGIDIEDMIEKPEKIVRVRDIGAPLIDGVPGKE